ncbi:MAG: ABC transporter substrate-binding protein [Helicobacteraceae bacterium]|jgi:NitT/TauT family transport system substrate-binding protein|nr:ABC transporter substrate-binding protein [Helicobacteraceae bacterium]
MSQITRREFLKVTGTVGALAYLSPLEALAAKNIPATLAIASTNYSWSVAFVAKTGGYWEKNGVEVTERDFTNGRDAMQAMLADSATFSTTTDTPLVFSLLRGISLHAVLDFTRHTRDMVIASIEGRGVSASDPQSLKGKTIGTPTGTSGQYLVSRYLKYAGLKDSDVTLINIAPSDLVNTLIRGDIDAFSWSLTSAKAAIDKSGGKAFILTQEGFEKFFVSHHLLLTNDQTIAKRGELLERTVKAFLDADKRIKEDPKWADLISARIRMPAEEIQSSAKHLDFSVNFNESLIDDLVVEAQWAIESGLSPEPKGDLRKILRGAIYERPLKKIAADRVNLS